MNSLFEFSSTVEGDDKSSCLFSFSKNGENSLFLPSSISRKYEQSQEKSGLHKSTIIDMLQKTNSSFLPMIKEFANIDE